MNDATPISPVDLEIARLRLDLHDSCHCTGMISPYIRCDGEFDASAHAADLRIVYAVKDKPE